jgi:hypothetical protein
MHSDKAQLIWVPSGPKTWRQTKRVTLTDLLCSVRPALDIDFLCALSGLLVQLRTVERLGSILNPDGDPDRHDFPRSFQSNDVKVPINGTVHFSPWTLQFHFHNDPSWLTSTWLHSAVSAVMLFLSERRFVWSHLPCVGHHLRRATPPPPPPTFENTFISVASLRRRTKRL